MFSFFAPAFLFIASLHNEHEKDKLIFYLFHISLFWMASKSPQGLAVPPGRISFVGIPIMHLQVLDNVITKCLKRLYAMIGFMTFLFTHSIAEGLFCVTSL